MKYLVRLGQNFSNAAFWGLPSAGVDLEQSRKEEEQQMLQDARQWLNSGRIEDVRQARSGATALHVAAAKGYSEVLRYGAGYWEKVM
jgi:uncharacterized membrane protein